MANNTFLSTSELDFDAYKTKLKTYLQGQAQFKDYDFDGSNMSVLLDIMAYNTYVNGFYLNMIGSEMFLDTAQLRESAVSKAKELNYVPRSRVSAKSVVKLTISGVTNGPSTITIPKGYYFSVTANSATYLFSTTEAHVLRYENNLYQSANLDVYEGRVVTEFFTVNSTSRYILSSSNVDVSSIEVVVQNSNTDTTETVFHRAYNLYGLVDTSPVFFVQGYSDTKYEVVFGNGKTGKKLTNGNIARITYRDCNGFAGNRLKPTKAVNSLDGYTNIKVTLVSAGSGGAEREEIDSIRFNAPRHFASQDRAVTKDDYSILIRNNFPTIEAIAVFGGEELAQKRYGKVVIATKPYDGEITPDSIKNEISSFLAGRTSVAIDPIFADPDYFYLKIVSGISYNSATTTKTTSDIESVVRDQIDNYRDSYLFDFNADFRYSKMTAMIDEADTSVVSNDTRVHIIKRIYPVLAASFTTKIYFNNEFTSEGIRYKLPKGHDPIVYSSAFTYKGTRNSYIQDDGLGNLYIYKKDAAGTITVLAQSVGSVDYTKGTVTITNLVVDSYTGHISIYAVPNAKDVVVRRNQIILIDQADVTITVDQASS